MRYLATGSMVLALFFGPVLAQSSQGGQGLSLGLGVVSAPRPYVDVDTETIPVPVLLYNRGGFYLRGVEAGYEWFREEPFSLRAFAVPRFEGYDEDDSDSLDGMDDRDFSLDTGLAIGWSWKHVAVTLDGATDVAGSSDGERATLQVEFPFRQGRWLLRPSVASSWLSDDVIDYYYGVDSSEAAPGRPAYEGESTTNLQASFIALGRINRRWSLLGLAYHVTYGGEIEDSPIVEDSSEIGGLLGLLYNF